jgi:hypothetical protein
LIELLLRCHEVEYQLGGRTWLRRLMSPRAFFPVAVLTFAIIVLCMGKSSVLLALIVDTVRGWADSLAYSVAHSSDQERLFCVACVLILVSIYAVHRTVRV